MNAAALRRPTAAKRGKAPAARKGSRGSATAWPEGTQRLARYGFAGLLCIMALVALVALDIPNKIFRAAGAATGQLGFAVGGYQIVGLRNMERRLADAVVADELRRAAAEAPLAGDRPAQALVDLDRIREALMQYGWVKDARVSRRLPDTLVVDIVERTPAAVWQHRGRLSLIDGEGVVLDAVPIDRMPDLPLMIGPGANRQAVPLSAMMDSVPTLKPQLASATWIGGRRWDLAFATGEIVALPEGQVAATRALQRFAKLDRSAGLLGRDMIRFDLRIPGRMIVRVPPGSQPPPVDATPEATG